MNINLISSPETQFENYYMPREATIEELLEKAPDAAEYFETFPYGAELIFEKQPTATGALIDMEVTRQDLEIALRDDSRAKALELFKTIAAASGVLVKGVETALNQLLTELGEEDSSEKRTECSGCVHQLISDALSFDTQLIELVGKGILREAVQELKGSFPQNPLEALDDFIDHTDDGKEVAMFGAMYLTISNALRQGVISSDYAQVLATQVIERTITSPAQLYDTMNAHAQKSDSIM